MTENKKPLSLPSKEAGFPSLIDYILTLADHEFSFTMAKFEHTVSRDGLKTSIPLDVLEKYKEAVKKEQTFHKQAVNGGDSYIMALMLYQSKAILKMKETR